MTLNIPCFQRFPNQAKLDWAQSAKTDLGFKVYQRKLIFGYLIFPLISVTDTNHALCVIVHLRPQGANCKYYIRKLLSVTIIYWSFEQFLWVIQNSLLFCHLFQR